MAADNISRKSFGSFKISPLDFDLAAMYGVKTGRLNEQVKRKCATMSKITFLLFEVPTIVAQKETFWRRSPFPRTFMEV